jgi:hypothetical protein
VHEFEFGLVQRMTDRVEVDGLPAGHAAAIRWRGQADGPFRCCRSASPSSSRVSSSNASDCRLSPTKQRGGFVVFDVAGRTAAPQHVVVHAGQIVVNQRIRVDQFDGAGDDLQLAPGTLRQFAGGEGKQRTNTRFPPPRLA